jgi:nucleoside-diphosphate-sugar epimerase
MEAALAARAGEMGARPIGKTTLRGGLFWGPGTGHEELWREEVHSCGFRVPGDGNAWVSLVHVEDYAAALVAVLANGRPNEAFIACEDEPLRLRELYARVAARERVDPPATGGAQRMRSFRVSNAKLRALGWRPQHSFCAAMEP